MLGCFLGGIVGDAYGSYAEFKERDTYVISKDMEITVFGLPPGSFTDDSSMMLCLAASFVETGKFSPIDQMERYSRWRRDGYMSSSVERGCFDIGRTTARAIAQYDKEVYDRTLNTTGHDDTPETEYFGRNGEYDAGNGGIMRLAPVPIFYYNDVEKAGHYSALSSKVTHASQECLESAEVMGKMIALLLCGAGKLQATVDVESMRKNLRCDKVIAICNGTYLEKRRQNIKTTGYVIDSLEAALWAFHCTDTFEKGLILLGGCGGDADTVCCIYGQIAGAFYGYQSIPKRWVGTLQRAKMVAKVAFDLITVAKRNGKAQ